MSSISPESDIIKFGYTLIPDKIDITAYKYIAIEGSVFHSYLITMVVTLVGTLVGVAMTTMIAYSLAIRELPGKSLISFFVLFTMLFSGGLVPTYMMWSNVFHIKNTIMALIAPSLLVNAFHILITKNVFPEQCS